MGESGVARSRDYSQSSAGGSGNKSKARAEEVVNVWTKSYDKNAVERLLDAGEKDHEFDPIDFYLHLYTLKDTTDEINQKDHRNLAKIVLAYYGRRWNIVPERKNKFVETLWSKNHFNAPAMEVGVKAVFRHLGIRRPEPRHFLFYKKCKMNQFLEETSLDGADHRRILKYLMGYFELTLEMRVEHLKSCSFFGEPPIEDYPTTNEEIYPMIGSFCLHLNLELPIAYRRHKRQTFVDELLENGKLGRISSDNAVKQALAHAGEDFKDRCWMITALSEWPVVAEELKKRSCSWVKIPRAIHRHKYLISSMTCTKPLHRHQVHDGVFVIQDEMELREAQHRLVGPFLQVTFVSNADPRIVPSPDHPSLIAVKAPSSKTFVIFFAGEEQAQEEKDKTEKLLQGLCRHIGKFPLLSRSVKHIVRYLKKYAETAVKWGNSYELANELTGGRRAESVTRWLWDLDFCPLTSYDWLENPLTKEQEYHLAYGMEIMQALIVKTGVDKIPLKVIKPAPPPPQPVGTKADVDTPMEVN